MTNLWCDIAATNIEIENTVSFGFHDKPSYFKSLRQINRNVKISLQLF